MASFIYEVGRIGLADATELWEDPTYNYKVMLVYGSYIANVSHTSVADISAYEVTGTGYIPGYGNTGRKDLSNRSIEYISGITKYLADPTVWSSLNVGEISGVVIIREYGGADSTSIPIAYIDSSLLPLFPITTDGGYLSLDWRTVGFLHQQQGTAYSGFSGFSGFSGYSGDNGIIGVDGISGYSGYSGSGVSGFSGYSGSGISGFSGLGLSGHSGFSGVSTSGYSGFSGESTSGYSGYSGSGVSGFSGYSGSGISGFSGSGISGFSGSGISGVSGYSGESTSGFSGYSGSGVSGFSGSGISGVSGYSGSGISGVSGYSGSGLSGVSGYSGSGISGVSGYSGSGVSGVSGYSGSGVSGFSGYSGSGVSGFSGYSGSGISGFSGSGVSGFSGYSGSGVSGVSGYSGTPGGAFTQGVTLYNSTGIANSALNIIAWRAPFNCTVTNVRGYRVGGTGATINARKNGTDNHLSSALSISSADTWIDGGAVQNTGYTTGDKLELMLVSTAGTVTQIGLLVDFTK
jgi:hypothetical protein